MTASRNRPFIAPIVNYDVAPDGQRFVMIRRDAADVPQRFHVITGWFEELAGRTAPRWTMSTPRATFVDRSTDTGELCPGVAVTLDTWLARSWDDGETEALEELATLRVRTRNSAYELVFVSAPAGHVLVRGGRYFPEWTRVCASWGAAPAAAS